MANHISKEKERLIGELLAKGGSIRGIAAEVGVAAMTVASRRRRLLNPQPNKTGRNTERLQTETRIGLSAGRSLLEQHIRAAEEQLGRLKKDLAILDRAAEICEMDFGRNDSHN
jgi:transposase-like protein